MAAATAPKRTKAQSAVGDGSASRRHVSAKELSDLLGRDRGTISEWLEDGCPVVQRGMKGVPHVFDLAEVVRWRERRAAEDAAEKAALAMPIDDDAIDGLPGIRGLKDPEKQVRTTIQLVKLAALRGAATPNAVALDATERALGLVRQTLMPLANRLLRELPGLSKEDARRVQELARKATADALKAARDALREGMDAPRTWLDDEDDDA